MRMDRGAVAAGPVVAAIVAGGFRVDDGVYAALWLTPDRADAWTPPPLDTLDAEAVAALLAREPVPEFLLLGTGATLAHPPRDFVAALEARGIGVEAMDSRAAARAWGVLRAEGRAIVAALYPLA